MPAPEVFYTVTGERLNEQFRTVEALDSKTATIFSFASAVLPVYGGLLAFSGRGLSALSWAFLIAGVVAYAVLLGVSYKAYQVGEWSVRPNVQDLRDNSTQYDEAPMKWWVAEERTRSVTENEGKLATKAHFVTASIVLLPVEAILLTLAAVSNLI